MLWRYLAVSRYYSNMDGLLRAQFAYPDVIFRNVVAPSATMPSSWYPLNMDATQVDTMWTLGVTDGVDAASSATSTADLSQFFGLKKKNDKRLADGVSFDNFMVMKQQGMFEEFSLFEDKQLQALFLQ